MQAPARRLACLRPLAWRREAAAGALAYCAATSLPPAALACLQAFLYCPSEPKDCALKLHSRLQQFAWTEAEVRRWLAVWLFSALCCW